MTKRIPSPVRVPLTRDARLLTRLGVTLRPRKYELQAEYIATLLEIIQHSSEFDNVNCNLVGNSYGEY